MQIKKNKTSIATTLFLTCAIAISLVALPVATAQEPAITKNTYAFCGVTPNPVGVGQEVLIWVGISDMLYVYTDGWEDLTVTVERPDGKTDTLGPLRTDSTGSTGTTYIPSMTGTYTFQTHFPAQTYNWTIRPIFDPQLYGLILYKASDSRKVELVVQEDPISSYPAHPLPTEYWTRPINAQHREWASISADWPAVPPNRYALYNDDAPETAHILWTKQLVTGGLAGGALGEHAYECGDAYEGKFGAGFPVFSYSVILGGVLYYNQYETRMPTQEVVAVDLKTGEELWRRPLLDPDGVSRRLSFGQTFYWDGWNYHAAFGYLWTTVGTNWYAYNPFSGDWIYTMTNVPSGTNVYGPKGEIYRYTIDLARGWMTLWNSSRTVQPQTSGTSGDGSWRPHGITFDARNGIEWNKTIATGLRGSANAIFFEDRVVGTSAAGWASVGDTPIAVWSISLKPGDEGRLLFNKNWTLPHSDLTMSFGAASTEDGVFTLRAKETRQWWGLSLDTGTTIWGPTASEADLGIFGMSGLIAYGKLYASNKMSGMLYCYDVKTGELLWTYEAHDPHNEILWSNNWPIYPVFIAGGKIYLGHSEHSPIDPKPRGAPFICLDAETGEEIFRVDGLFRQTDWGGQAIIGDSIIATMDTYDQRIYAIGKGPSATTVTASPKISIYGNNVLVEGMVTDISPGTDDFALQKRFPNGVPAVSDESMGDWMGYVYLQNPRPTDVVGVEVVISVLDPNNNYYEVGTATSEANGFFKATFTPEVPGEYFVYATFEGSQGYWPSNAVTSINVEEAPAVAAPTPTVAPMTDMYVTGFGVGIIIAIVVVGLLLVLMLRKR